MYVEVASTQKVGKTIKRNDGINTFPFLDKIPGNDWYIYYQEKGVDHCNLITGSFIQKTKNGLRFMKTVKLTISLKISLLIIRIIENEEPPEKIYFGEIIDSKKKVIELHTTFFELIRQRDPSPVKKEKKPTPDYNQIPSSLNGLETIKVNSMQKIKACIYNAYARVIFTPMDESVIISYCIDNQIYIGDQNYISYSGDSSFRINSYKFFDPMHKKYLIEGGAVQLIIGNHFITNSFTLTKQKLCDLRRTEKYQSNFFYYGPEKKKNTNDPFPTLAKKKCRNDDFSDLTMSDIKLDELDDLEF